MRISGRHRILEGRIARSQDLALEPSTYSASQTAMPLSAGTRLGPYEILAPPLSRYGIEHREGPAYDRFPEQVASNRGATVAAI